MGLVERRLVVVIRGGRVGLRITREVLAFDRIQADRLASYEGGILFHEVVSGLLDAPLPDQTAHAVGAHVGERCALVVVLGVGGLQRAELHRVAEAAHRTEGTTGDAVVFHRRVRRELVGVEELVACRNLRLSDDVPVGRHIAEGGHAHGAAALDLVGRGERTGAPAVVDVADGNADLAIVSDVAAQDVAGVALHLVALVVRVDLEGLGRVPHFDRTGIHRAGQRKTVVHVVDRGPHVALTAVQIVVLVVGDGEGVADRQIGLCDGRHE